MIEAEPQVDAEEFVHNVLRNPLEPVQLALLSAIWDPIAYADDYGGYATWPLWDFVSRTLYKAHPEVDAAEVLLSLPRLATGRMDRESYGLIWWGGGGMAEGRPPELDVNVGLTVAGLFALGQIGAGRTTADELAQVIQSMAHADAQVKPNPREVVSSNLLLSDYTKPLREESMQKPFEFSDYLTTTVLQHEFTPFRVNRDTKYVVGGAWLWPYLNVTDSTEYLDVINARSLALQQTEPVVSPLTLVQTMDYLTYVLSTHPNWPKKVRLVNAPDLESACMLGLPARSHADYEARLSALFNVIDRFNVPRPESAGRVLTPSELAPLNLLQTWIDAHVGEPQKSEAISALGVLRAARALRNARQHSSMETRKAAMKARRSFGLPDVTSDWGHTWTVVQARVAVALDEIRKSVQAG